MPSKKSKSGKKADYKFDKDEKVLVLPKQAGEDIYEAKVLDRKLDKQKEPQYKIHYKGWNKRWDEWVNQRRLLKINASNVQIMSEKNNQNKLAQQQKDRQSQSTRNGGGGHNSSSNDTESINSKSPSPTNRKRKIRGSSSKGSSSSKRRKLNNNNNNNKMDNDSSSSSSDNDNNNNDNDDDYDISQEENRKRKKRRSPKASRDDDQDVNANNNNNHHQALEISLPTPLKRKLITDWENITKKHLLIELPRKKDERISEILSDFEQFSIEQGQDKNIVYEISRGIKDYFNQALQVTLLYKLERQQHGTLIAKHKHLTMDQIYGVEHLCRLFVKLPQLLSPTDLDNDTRKILKDQIECIIAFVLDHEKKYFCTQYIQS